ncbi:MAG: hypothetical protein ACK44F_12765 [Roseococcus sp.]
MRQSDDPAEDAPGEARGLVLIADDRETICQPLGMMVRGSGHGFRQLAPGELGAALEEGGVMAVITGISRWIGGAAEALLLVGGSGARASVLLVSGAPASELELARRLGPPLGVDHVEALALPLHARDLRGFLSRAAARQHGGGRPRHGA